MTRGRKPPSRIRRGTEPPPETITGTTERRIFIVNRRGQAVESMAGLVRTAFIVSPSGQAVESEARRVRRKGRS